MSERTIQQSDLPFLPKNDYVMAVQARVAEKIGSLFIPEKVRDNNASNQGTVVALGPSCPDFCGIVVGEDIVWPQHAEHRIVIDDTTYILIPWNQVMCGNAHTIHAVEDINQPELPAGNNTDFYTSKVKHDPYYGN